MSVKIGFDVEGIEEVQKALDKLPWLMHMSVQRALQRVGADIHMDARRMCPVVTDRLRNSIYHKVEHWLLTVGAKAPYAYYVEFGTHYIQPRYFLTEALNLNLPKLHGVLSRAMNHAIRVMREEAAR